MRIYHINIGSPKNYLIYESDDSFKDFYHAKLGLKDTIEEIKKKGDNTIRIEFDNESIEKWLTKGIKRAQTIAKDTGYTLEIKKEYRTYGFLKK